MHIEIEISEEQATQLKALAHRLGVEPSELVRSACLDLLAIPSDDVLQVAKQVLEKNRELYRRLA